MSWRLIIHFSRLNCSFFTRLWRHLLKVFSESVTVSCRYILIELTISMLSYSSKCIFEWHCVYFLSFQMFFIGWTLTTKQLLKHLKISLFSHSHIIRHSLSSTVWAGVRSLCECVCFVSLLYESCQMANIHFCFIKSAFSHPPSHLVSSSFFLHILHPWCYSPLFSNF